MGVSQTLTVIAGRYRLENLIGEGGMASIWRAKDLTLARPVAVKLLFERDDRDHEALVARFLREARIAAAVQHRNVIHIVDFGTTETGQPFMVMELLEGESLGQRLQRKTRLPLAELVHITSMTLRGLAAVHDAGIIHRDLKPDNIFLKEEGGVVYPKILDFGISRSVEPASGRRSALTTREGIIVGTPEYMSPEQARGLKNIDRRTDLYSMGVILYQAITGTLPFESENVGDLIVKVVTTGAKPAHEVAPDVPLAFSALVARAMARAPEDRFRSATEMLDALVSMAQEVLGDELQRPISDTPPLSLSIPAGAGVLPRDAPPLSREFSLKPDELPRAKLPPIALPEAPHVATTSTDELATQLIGKPKRRGLWWSLALAGVLGAVAIGWTSRKVAPPDVTSQPSSPTGASAPNNVTAPSALPSTAAQTVTVTLRSVPKTAKITVDGNVMPESTFTLPKDGSSHTVVVSADGRTAWQAVYVASLDQAYDVLLGDAATPPPTAARTNPTPSQTRRASKVAGANKKPSKAPAALRHLDF